MKSTEVSIISSNLLTTTVLPIIDTGRGIDRGALFIELVKENKPDSAGLCEVTPEWLEYIRKFCDKSDTYGVTGTGREVNPEDGELRSGSGEYVPILYRKDRFEVIADGGWWYSETPDVPSRFEIPGHAAMKYDRVVSYAVFMEKETGISYVHMNVHFDHKCDEYIYVLCSKLTEEKGRELSKRHGDIPVIITGDFNVEEDSGAYKYLSDGSHGFFDTKYKAERYNPIPTFVWSLDEYDPSVRKGKIIDFVIASTDNVKALWSDVITKPHFSDHYAAVSAIKIENKD